MTSDEAHHTLRTLAPLIESAERQLAGLRTRRDEAIRIVALTNSERKTGALAGVSGQYVGRLKRGK